MKTSDCFWPKWPSFHQLVLEYGRSQYSLAKLTSCQYHFLPVANRAPDSAWEGNESSCWNKSFWYTQILSINPGGTFCLGSHLSPLLTRSPAFFCKANKEAKNLQACTWHQFHSALSWLSKVAKPRYLNRVCGLLNKGLNWFCAKYLFKTLGICTTWGFLSDCINLGFWWFKEYNFLVVVCWLWQGTDNKTQCLVLVLHSEIAPSRTCRTKQGAENQTQAGHCISPWISTLYCHYCPHF